MDGSLQLKRIIKAPRGEVFRAWTDPNALTQWFGPRGYATPSADIDLRPGGTYRLAMKKLPDGDLFYLTGSYREVRPPERLVYTWRWEAEPHETLVTVEFRDFGASTEIVLTHEFFPDQERRDGHEHGWGGCFERLTELLTA